MENDQDKDLVTCEEEAWRKVPPDLGSVAGPAALVPRKASLWALVLESRSVPCRIEREGSDTVLLVPPESYDTALEELRLFEKENRDWPPSFFSPPFRQNNTLATLSVLLLLATFHNFIRIDSSFFGYAPLDWVQLGCAHAGKILDGQWWRTVTSLTLHSDVVHLLGNLAIGGLFILFLCADLGSGLAWVLLLLSGIAGTAVNAWFQPWHHTSIGASTLVFGAVGILGALPFVRERNRWGKRRLLPVAGTLALLALLGTEGENTDIGAHLFGFVSGVVLGLVAGIFLERFGRPGPRANALLALCAAAVPLFAWWAALSFGG